MMGKTQVKNLGELFREAKKGQLTEKQRNKKVTNKQPNTGIRYVHTLQCSGCKQGFTWRYAITLENGERQILQSISLLKLKKRVKAAGLPWEIYNEVLARKSAIRANITYDQLLSL